MAPSNYKLNLYRGDSASWTFKFWKDDAKTQPVDLTNAVIEAEIREKPSGTTIISLDCVLTSQNVVDVKLTTAHWLKGIPEKGVWDMQVTLPDGTVYSPLAGAVTVTLDVTDS